MKQEKGNSQGFNTAEVLLCIILPQAYRNIVPTLLSQVITTIKDSSYFLRWSFGGRGWISRAAQNKKEPGSRLPAAASCLGRHAHPAGRSPNSSSLLLPLAAVVAVALGYFCAVFSDVAAAVRIHP